LPNLPATINRLAWSNLAAQSAEQIAPAAAPGNRARHCERSEASIWKSGPDCFVALLLAMTAARP
jgi:hypothetical protein